MFWRGCLQLLLIFGLFFGLLYSLYLVIRPMEKEANLNDMELLEAGLYYKLLDLKSDKLEEFGLFKDSNYPPKAEIDQGLSEVISRMDQLEALGVVPRYYLDHTRIAEFRMIDRLMGLNQGHIAALVDKISSEDGSGEFTFLCAYLLKDIRGISSDGWNEARQVIMESFENKYFGETELSLAVSSLSAGRSIKIGRALGLTEGNGVVIRPAISARLLRTLAANALAGGLDYQGYVENLFYSSYDMSPSERDSGLVLLALFEEINENTPQWMHGLMDSLVVLSNDDILTAFIEKSEYVKHRFGGLYQTYNPLAFQFLQQSTRQKISAILKEGYISLLENQIIEDLEIKETGRLAENSLSYYSDLIESEPFNPYNYIERGKILADQYGDYKRSVTDFTRAINLDKTLADAYFQRSLAREKLNDIEGSISDYDMVLIYEPDNIYALANRGIMKHQIGDYIGAIQDYSETISIDKNYVDAYYNRAITRSILGDTAGALRDYELTLKLDSYHQRAYNNKALINLELNREEEALSDYLKLLSINEDNVDALYGIAYTFYVMDSLNRSEDYYVKLTEKYPNEVGAFYSLGVIYNDEAQYQKAYSFLTKTIFMDSTYIDAYIQRGLTSLNLGDTLNACLDWVKANASEKKEVQFYLLNYCKN